MKVRIDKKGNMFLMPETGLEEYTLGKFEQDFKDGKVTITFEAEKVKK